MARSARAAGGTVKLTGSQLAELPEWLLRDAAADGMTQLLLGKNSLEEVPDLRFAQRLSALSVSGNRLQELRPASLPPSVEDFEAVNNQISAVHEAFLAELPKLTRFDLRGNLLTRECFEAAAGALPALRRLQILDLSSNRFVSFPDLVVSPPSLLELNLSLNPLAGPLPPLSRAAGLVRLSLVRCGLSDLPPEIMALPHLELLDVARNALAALPAPEARALRCLYAARNRRDVGTAAWPPWEPPRGRRGNRRVAAVGTAAWPPWEPPRGRRGNRRVAAVGTAAWPPWEPPRGRRGNRRVAAVGTAAWPPWEPPRGRRGNRRVAAVGTAAWPPWDPPRGRRGNRRVAATWPPGCPTSTARTLGFPPSSSST